MQREGLIQGGGGFGVTTSWDNRWKAETSFYPDKWIVEMAIPFKTIRYNEELTKWRINFSRNNYKCNETSCWISVPRNQNVASLGFTGDLIWDNPPPRAGANISLIPYVALNQHSDYQNDTSTWKPGAGFDAKIAVTSSLNLDLTVNPDFSQVEVDRQVTNLDRFSIFFPERRQFFIENSDLFGQFGFSRIRPFFSRRIGLSNGQAIPILGGARLSGKLNQNWRVGFMNMQQEGVGIINSPAQNYTVAAFQRQVLKSSNIAGIFVNRQGFSGNSPEWNDYNRLAGIDFNYYSQDFKWRGKAFYHQTFDNDPDVHEGAQAVWLMYNTPKLQVHYNHEWVGRNYNAEVGFVPRTGYFRFEPIASYWNYPKKGIFQSHGPSLYSSIYWNYDWELTDRQIRASYNFKFLNQAVASVGVTDWFLKLQFPFDVTNTGGTALPVGDYYYRNVSASYTSDFRKRFNYNAYGNYGSYFNGTKLTWGGSVNYRTQPWGQFGLSFENNNIQQPDSFPDANLWLIGPQIQVSFTKSIFLTTFFQYNTQINNFNINARFQWRFKPMSDLFIVVTENHASDNFGIKNRAVALKLNYWLTL